MLAGASATDPTRPVETINAKANQMDKSIEDFSRHAAAEKIVSEQAGPLLARIIAEVEKDHGVKVRELRVTFDGHENADEWRGPTCVIVR